MLKILSTTFICLSMFSSLSMAKDELKTQKEKAAYVIGTQIAKQLVISKDELDLDSLKLGMLDVFTNKKLKLSREEIQKTMMTFQESKIKKEKALIAKLAKEGKEFLEKNKKRKGVITLKSGLQYKVLKKGKGKVSVSLSDTVKTHYRGTLINGVVFDSSYDRGAPATFPVSGVIKAWTEALLKMRVGDKWQLVVPSALAYGKRGAAPSIGPDATLIFEVELLEIIKAKK